MCLVFRLCQVGMAINIKDAPHFIILAEGIMKFSCFFLCLFFLLNGVLNESLGYAALCDDFNFN